jgi:glucose/arabinose dehydrogenase
LAAPTVTIAILLQPDLQHLPVAFATFAATAVAGHNAVMQVRRSTLTLQHWERNRVVKVKLTARLAAAALIFLARETPKTWAQAIQQGAAAVELRLMATVGSGASTPNFGANSGDPRFLYIGQKTGAIRILDLNQSNPLLATSFLNMSTALGGSFLVPGSSFDETGLLGGAFHPNFHNAAGPGAGKFYTYTSETLVSNANNFTHSELGVGGGNHQSVIREWTANAPDANGVITINTSIASRVLMRINQPQANHNGGALAFGNDGYLYISLGDGGGGNDLGFGANVNTNTDGHTNVNNPDSLGFGFAGHGNAQDRRNVYGKILRIKSTTDADVQTFASANGQYRIPNDNPFTEASNPMGDQLPGWQAGWVDEIYAYGLRNPFRMGFDSETGDLFAGDVGQSAWEEVNRIQNGGNYGWVAREGLNQNPSYPLSSFPTYVAPSGSTFLNPVAAYPNGTSGTGGQAVMGGFVYRGDTMPALEGKYVFGEHNRQNSATVGGGRILYMNVPESGQSQVFDVTITGPVAKPISRLHGIAEDANGELYYLFENGQIMRLLPEFLLGDYHRDGVVDQLDIDAWTESFGRTGTNLAADGNRDGVVDAADYVLVQKIFGTSVLDGAGGGGGQVPEPAIGFLLLPILALCRSARSR